MASSPATAVPSPSSCSKSCQKSAWRIHKQVCTKLGALRLQNETAYDQMPMARRMARDVDGLPRLFGDQVHIAARSALKLGKPSSMEKSHCIALTFRWTADHTDWTRRFSFEGACVLTFDDALSGDYVHMSKESQPTWKTMLAQKMQDRVELASAPADTHGATPYCVLFVSNCVLPDGDQGSATHCESLAESELRSPFSASADRAPTNAHTVGVVQWPQRTALQLESFKQLPLHPDWPDLLRRFCHISRRAEPSNKVDMAKRDYEESWAAEEARRRSRG